MVGHFCLPVIGRLCLPVIGHFCLPVIGHVCLPVIGHLCLAVIGHVDGDTIALLAFLHHMRVTSCLCLSFGVMADGRMDTMPLCEWSHIVRLAVIGRLCVAANDHLIRLAVIDHLCVAVIDHLLCHQPGATSSNAGVLLSVQMMAQVTPGITLAQSKTTTMFSDSRSDHTAALLDDDVQSLARYLV